MDIKEVSREDLAELAKIDIPYSVSIFIPTHAYGVEVNKNQDHSLFKNKLQEASHTLESDGMHKDAISSLLKPGHDLLDDEAFWKSQEKGLAVFMSDGFFKFYKTDQPLVDEVYIDKHFYLTPLVQTVTRNSPFYVLEISRHTSKLFKGDMHALEPVEIPELPKGMHEGRHAAGEGTHLHGNQNGQAGENEYLAQYFKEIDKTLWGKVLNNETAPLVLAGVEYEVAAYRNISEYRHLVSDFVRGNAEHTNLRKLHDESLAVLAPHFDELETKALENYFNGTAAGLTSTIVEDIVPAAFYAKVSTLFARQGFHLWGKFDMNENKLDVHAEKQPYDSCLVNMSVIQTLVNGGDVFVLEDEKIPEESPMAALMRY